MNKNGENGIRNSNAVRSAIRKFSKNILGRSVFVAYSGGVDSHVLLVELEKCFKKSKTELVALHFNHQYSKDSDIWEMHCQETCTKLDIKIITGRNSQSEIFNGGKENSFRIARYRWFKSVIKDGDILVTAHHLDDQIETLMFRLIRGTGIKGMAAIEEQRKFGNGQLYRPFLGVPRKDILEVARDGLLRWVEDKSNTDESYDRNYIRRRVLPLIQSRWPSSPTVIYRATRNLQRAQKLLEEIGESDFRNIHEEASNCRFSNYGKINIHYLNAMSTERTENLLRYWVQKIGYEAPSSSKLTELLRQLRTSGRINQTCVRWGTVEFRRYRGHLYLLPMQEYESNRIIQRRWNSRQEYFGEIGIRLNLIKTIGRGLKKEGLELNKLIIKNYRKKHQIRLYKNGRTKSLAKLFQELGVPPWERYRIPIVTIEEEVICVPGIGCTEHLLVNSYEPGIDFSIEET
ncbi:MAG: tRNA lysidine(34) synthetase TilS [Acidiferrobacteraceae bacterium]|nr:tRNA lysidine(34) synthetase TilS [Acidiferrobacteraceae bacterium]|tara:strand:- start:35485 stop:36864 length:1380 start_codon:yes stop_codon:yes gene_type:complete